MVFCMCSFLFAQNNFIRPFMSFSVVESKSRIVNDLNTQLISNYNTNYIANRFNNIVVGSNVHSNVYPSEFVDYKSREKEKLKKDLVANYNSVSIDFQKISKEIISDIYGFDQNSFDINRSIQLAMNSSSETELSINSKSVDKSKLVIDLFDKMMNRVYILTVFIRKIETQEEYYSRTNYSNGERNEFGYRCYVDFYLTKVSWSEDYSNYFYNNCWVDSDTPKGKRRWKLKNFEKIKFETNLVFCDRILARSLDSKIYSRHSMDELMSLLPDMISNLIMQKLVKFNSDFRIQSSLSDVYPNRAKIGKKEGVKKSDRYFAFDKIEKRNGSSKLRRRAVLRVQNIEDNSINISKKSDFQQQGGKKLYPGITIVENPSSGLNINLNYSHFPLNEVVNFDKYSISASFGPFASSKERKKLKNKYIGLTFGFNNFKDIKFLKSDTITRNGFVLPVQFNFNKDRYFTKKGNVFINTGLTVSGNIIGFFDDEDSNISPLVVSSSYGLGIGIHLGPRLSLISMPQINYNIITIDTESWMPIDSKLIDPIWGLENNGKNMLSNSIILRLQF